MSIAGHVRPSTPRDRLLDVLRVHLSMINSLAALRLAAQRAGVDADALRDSDIPPMVSALRASLPVLLSGRDNRAACTSALEALLTEKRNDSERTPEPSAVHSRRGPESRANARVLEVSTEDDVVTARDAARRACQELGFSPVNQVKVVTATSEVTRNIVMYARSGWLEIRRLSSPHVGIEIVATDHGPGIANLDAIFAGEYRSRRGMGMGLRGSRSLMDDLQVQTAPGVGTTVRMRKFRS